MQERRSLAWLAAASVLALTSSLSAALQPDQIFVVYNRNQAESRSLAEYYVQKRGLPLTQSIGLDLPATDEMTREAYLAKLRGPLRAWLAPREPAGQDPLPRDDLWRSAARGGHWRGPCGPAAAEGDDRGTRRRRQRPAGPDGNAGGAGRTVAAGKCSRRRGPIRRSSLPVYEKLRDKAYQHLQAAPSRQEAARLAAELEEPLKRGEGVQTFVEHMQSSDPAGKALIASLQADVARRRSLTKQSAGRLPSRPEAARGAQGAERAIRAARADRTPAGGQGAVGGQGDPRGRRQ